MNAYDEFCIRQWIWTVREQEEEEEWGGGEEEDDENEGNVKIVKMSEIYIYVYEVLLHLFVFSKKYMYIWHGEQYKII